MSQLARGAETMPCSGIREPRRSPAGARSPSLPRPPCIWEKSIDGRRRSTFPWHVNSLLPCDNPQLVLYPEDAGQLKVPTPVTGRG